ncbi:hypothetical protein [Streptomyces narbonensis]|nr:hypothetical protein [Streptomyces narbonensis]GGW05971.1 hypothetical protein GCM10010230_47060 [Streptomyces narbonensis]
MSDPTGPPSPTSPRRMRAADGRDEDGRDEGDRDEGDRHTFLTVG